MHGAEARVTRTAGGYLKRRDQKTYRHPELDLLLRTSRTKRETTLLSKAAANGIRVPAVTVVDPTTLLVEAVHGWLVRETLDAEPALAEKIGACIARLHDAHLTHGDLTTSNMLVSEGEIVLIDFGLGAVSSRIEDKAVDLQVFRQSLEGRHCTVAETAWRAFLKGYKASVSYDETLARLRKVRVRGRNKGGS